MQDMEISGNRLYSGGDVNFDGTMERYLRILDIADPKNPKELASAMIRLAKNSKERESFGDAGYKFVNEICNSKAMATNSVKIYHDAIGNNRHK